jgi:hypothetical protein
VIRLEGKGIKVSGVWTETDKMKHRDAPMDDHLHERAVLAAEHEVVAHADLQEQREGSIDFSSDGV